MRPTEPLRLLWFICDGDCKQRTTSAHIMLVWIVLAHHFKACWTLISSSGTLVVLRPSFRGVCTGFASRHMPYRDDLKSLMDSRVVVLLSDSLNSKRHKTASLHHVFALLVQDNQWQFWALYNIVLMVFPLASFLGSHVLHFTGKMWYVCLPSLHTSTSLY